MTTHERFYYFFRKKPIDRLPAIEWAPWWDLTINRWNADGMLPLERQAGVDVSLYLKKQQDMFFLGHFDKMCMKFGENAT